MKKKIYKLRAALIITLTNLLICSSIWAQSPQKMSYQAVIRDASNNLVTNHAVGMRVSILQGSATGTVKYQETYNPDPQTNTNGLVTIEIGSGLVITGTFAGINWSEGPYFIKTETDPTGSTTYTITGTSQLLSVPYALHAKTAESITGGITETDPVFGTSVAAGITATDTTNWNNKLDNETQNIQNVLLEGNDAGSNSLNNVSQLTIGSSVQTPSAALEINSTNGALLLSRITTSQRDALNPVAGMIIYNTTTSKFQGYRSSYYTLDVSNLSSGSGMECNGAHMSLGQSYTAGITGVLTQIDVDILDVYEAGNYTFQVIDGNGIGGTVLSDQIINISATGIINITIPATVNIIAGQQYTMLFSTTNEDSMGFDWMSSNGTDDYAGGHIWVSGSVYTYRDLWFKTYVNSSTWVDLH